MVRRPNPLPFLKVLLFFTIACRRDQSTAGSSAEPTKQPAKSISRIVSLTPSVTEIIFELGAGDRVVGVSDYCDFPDEVRTRSRIGNFLRPDLEKILALAPDLVLADAAQVEITQALGAAGIRSFALPMGSISEVQAGIRQIATVLDANAAGAALLDRLDRDLGPRASPRGPQPRRPRALFVVDREPGGLRGLVAAGPGSYLDELLTRAGADNLFFDLPVRYARVSVEDILDRRPDLILDAVHVAMPLSQQALMQDWQALAGVPAMRSGHVYHLPQRYFVTPGPRLGQALRDLRRLIKGELPPSAQKN